jgi:ribosomal protein L18
MRKVVKKRRRRISKRRKSRIRLKISQKTTGKQSLVLFKSTKRK